MRDTFWVKHIRNGGLIPRGYGLVDYAWEYDTHIVSPIPLNQLYKLWRYIYGWLRVGWRPYTYNKSLDVAERRGYKQAQDYYLPKLVAVEDKLREALVVLKRAEDIIGKAI